MYNGNLKLRRPEAAAIQYDTLSLNPANGVLVSTISGMTAVSATLNTSTKVSGVGENIYGQTIKGKPLTVEGFILDDNKPLKSSMLAIVQAGNVGTLELDCQNAISSSNSKTQYVLDVIVKDAPTISQENHSKFSFTLYAPTPYWRTVNPASFTGFVNDTSNPNVYYYGNVEADYTLKFKADKQMNKATFTYASRKLVLDFTTAVSANTEVVFSRGENGRVKLTVGGIEHNEYIDLSNTTLWMLPVHGAMGAKLKVEGASGIALASSSLEYYTRYASVISWGSA